MALTLAFMVFMFILLYKGILCVNVHTGYRFCISVPVSLSVVWENSEI